MSRIGLIGCGWLGKPLAHSLSKEHEVQCFSRKAQSESGFDYVLNPKAGNSFWDNEIFIIAISTRDNYLKTLEEIAHKCAPPASLILMSSTSVYKEFDGQVDETASITQKSTQTQAEALMLTRREKLLILRLGGLMGEDRIAGRWKSVSSFPDGPVNYIHQDDVIAIVQKMIRENIQNGIYNLVAPEHPLRSEVHAKNSEAFGFELRKFEGETDRIVSSAKVITRLDYDFIHPDPLAFWSSL
jgi:nucleoside-diphosphate-sugar epimerase